MRVPVWFRVSKGVIMPRFGFKAWKLVLQNEIIHLHLPQFDAAGVALRGRILKKPTVISYHSDLLLPKGILNRFVNLVVHFMNNLSAIFSHRIGAYTEDFARHSPFLRRFNKKVEVILPPVELPTPQPEAVEIFREKHNPGRRHPVIGMATRFAAEKGVEVLLEALSKVILHYPDTIVLFAGQFQDVWKEEVYFERLLPMIRNYQVSGGWRFLGVLSPDEISAFYSNLDVLVVPSLNSTETFGLVQIEAMINGIPCVASDLPGVRQPIVMTGMGKVVPIGDADALAKALLDIFDHPDKYTGDTDFIAAQFNPKTNAAAYEKVYREIQEFL